MMIMPLRHALRPAFAPRFQAGMSHRLGAIRHSTTLPDSDDLAVLDRELDQVAANKQALKHLEEEAKEPGVIETYGWYPFIGLSLTALISKELIVLSPANLLGTYSMVGLGVGWLLFGETLKKAASSEFEDERKQQQNMMDAVVELTKAEIAIWKTKGVEATLLEQYRVESEQVNARWATAQVLKARHVFRGEMMQRLTEVLSREQTEIAQAQAKLINDAIAYVRNKFAKRDPQTDQETFEFALLGLGEEGVKLPKDKDPVRKAFAEFFKSRGQKS
jgi:hypothetical protein